MKKTKLSASLALPLLNKITKLSVGQINIPEEWNQLFDIEEKTRAMLRLQHLIVTSGFYNPIIICKVNGKYSIVDGVLRFKVLIGLSVQEIDCIIIDKEPDSSDILKDWIIECNFKSLPTQEEQKKFLIHYLRIGKEDELDGLNFNTRYKFLKDQYGRGWGRNSVIDLKRALQWHKNNPENKWDLPDKVLSSELAASVAGNIVDLLTKPEYDYSLDKDKVAKIIPALLAKKINFEKAKSLVRSYNNKIKSDCTQINIPVKLSSDRYEILPGNCLDAEFRPGTKLDCILTSVPYFQQIEYGEKGAKGQEFEIGQEKTKKQYVSNLIAVMKKGAENMKDSGVFVINIHDSYQDGGCLGVVALLTVEMQKAGFFYIDQVVWEKSNNKPQGNKTKRFTNGYESVLLFAKSKDYFYEQLKIYNPDKKAKLMKGCKEQGKTKGYHIANNYDTIRNFLCDNDIEQILRLNISKDRSQKTGLQNGFFGSFPTLLPVPFILSFTPDNGTIWDPFGGTGTTGRVALMLNRKVIISELYQKNLEKISEILEKGTTEYNENNYISLKNDFLDDNESLQEVA